MDGMATRSFQFFDQTGAGAFKALSSISDDFVSLSVQ